jgi:HEAT repeat protein
MMGAASQSPLFVMVMSTEPKPLSPQVKAIVRQVNTASIDKIDAVEAFSKIEDLNELIAVLRDGNPTVAEAAALAFQPRIQEKHIPILIDCIKLDKANTGLIGLILKDHAAIVFPILVQIVKDTQNSSKLRCRAVLEIQKLAYPAAVGFYEEMLEDSDNEIKYFALHGIGRSDSPTKNKVLLKTLNDNYNNKDIHEVVCSSFEGTEEISTFDFLIEELKFDDPRVQRYAINALGKLGDTRALNYLLPLIDIPPFHDTIVSTLGLYNDQRIIQPLINIYNKDETSRYTRRDIILSFHSLDTPELRDFYVNLLQNEDEYIVIMAAYALTRIGGRQGLPHLLRALKSLRENSFKDDSPGFTMKFVADSLAMLQDKIAVEPLIETLNHDLMGKFAVIEALGKLGDKRAVPTLIFQLKSWHISERANAIIALGQLGDQRALPHLKQIALHDKARRLDKELKILAQEAIAKIPAKKKSFFFWM